MGDVGLYMPIQWQIETFIGGICQEILLMNTSEILYTANPM